jgi:hypothetical protein
MRPQWTVAGAAVAVSRSHVVVPEGEHGGVSGQAAPGRRVVEASEALRAGSGCWTARQQTQRGRRSGVLAAWVAAAIGGAWPSPRRDVSVTFHSARPNWAVQGRVDPQKEGTCPVPSELVAVGHSLVVWSWALRRAPAERAP